MNKPILVLGILSMVSHMAMAQADDEDAPKSKGTRSAGSAGVQVYGRIDLSVGKAIGSSQKYLADGSSSRFGLRGSEDLGDGWSAMFNVEHRFEADTGAAGNGIAGRSSPGPRFWYGRSVVGIEGPYGAVYLGREYSPAFQMVRVKSTAFGYDFVTSSNAVTTVLGLGIGTTRNDSAVTYKGRFGPVDVSAQVAEATDSLSTFQVKPEAYAVAYNDKGIYAGISYEHNGLRVTKTASIINTYASYNFKVVKLGAAFIKGNTERGEDRKGWMLSLTAPVGLGEIRGAYGARTINNGRTKDTQVAALGYYYNLSKRTAVYADYVHNSKFATEKTGYDMGIKHQF